VTLAYGKRFEPWIEALAPLEEALEESEVQNPIDADGR
jgi:hypothetical protein